MNLRGTHVTDTGLAPAAGMADLRWLDIGHTAVTDAGLEHLRSLRQLRIMFIDGSKVTSRGVAELKKTLRELQIGAAKDRERE